MDNIIEAVHEVHSILGAGHSESTYHSAMERELSLRGIPFSSENTIPIFYKGHPIGRRHPDLFVDTEDGTVAVELKAGNSYGEDQLTGYLTLLGDDDNVDVVGGLLLRFNDTLEVVRS